MSAERCVLLFTKPSQPGRVKTRLIGALTAEQAARLHAAFLGDVLERLRGGAWELEIAWALAPGEAPPEAPVPGFAQRGEDLGERLYRGLLRAARSHPRVAAVGSDHPELPSERVEEAFRALEGGRGRRADVVLGPAEDGGYYLVAVSAAALSRELFEGIPWSTPGVLAATLERCRSLGLAAELLPEGRDVDTGEDLERLAAALAERPGLDCPRTRALLAGWAASPAVPSR